MKTPIKKVIAKNTCGVLEKHKEYTVFAEWNNVYIIDEIKAVYFNKDRFLNEREEKEFKYNQKVKHLLDDN